MRLQSEHDLIELVKKDEWMMQVLHYAKTLGLPDWWVCAGFVRSKIWDVLHEFTNRTPLADVDVIYFDPSCIDESAEKQLEQQLMELDPTIPWSVKNEARMHLTNGIPPYSSAVDAIAKFPETATALGLSLDQNDDVILAAPHGIEDVIQLRIKPTPYFVESSEKMEIYKQRVRRKGWEKIWGGVCVKA